MSKRTFIIFAVFLALSAMFSVLALAQSQSQGESPALPNSGLDGQGGGRYRVGPGDILDVRVFGQPDLNSTVEIDSDGNISSLPFIEVPIPAKCRDEREIQKSITEAYAKYIIKPRVSVRVLERRSRPPAVVYGAVRNAARFQMMRRVKLHELLASAAGSAVLTRMMSPRGTAVSKTIRATGFRRSSSVTDATRRNRQSAAMLMRTDTIDNATIPIVSE